MSSTINVIEYFFKDNQARFSSETIRSYTISLNQFFEFCKKEYDKVKRVDIRIWHEHLNDIGLKTSSITLKLAAIRSFYKYLIEENILQKNPIDGIESPKIEEKFPYYLNQKQLAQLMEVSCEDVKKRVIIETLYSTGVRVSELLNIKLSDIKWDTRQIWIRKGKGNKERFALFTTECAERLKVYIKNEGIKGPYLFPNVKDKPLSRTWVESFFRDYTKKLGFRVYPHLLRITFASHLAEKNMPISYIQELLGHENINTTKRYTKLCNEARKKLYDSYQ